jgi:hypothetical protein
MHYAEKCRVDVDVFLGNFYRREGLKLTPALSQDMSIVSVLRLKCWETQIISLWGRYLDSRECLYLDIY